MYIYIYIYMCAYAEELVEVLRRQPELIPDMLNHVRITLLHTLYY